MNAIMSSTALTPTLTFVTSEAQGDLHVFVSDAVAPQTIHCIASNLSIRVQQAVHVFHDNHLSQYRLCPVPSGAVLSAERYGELWYCCDLSEPLLSGGTEDPSNEQSDDLETLDSARAVPMRIPRPCNSWILYRRAKSKVIQETHPGCTTAQMSTIIAGMWRSEPAAVKAEWQELAKKEEQLHAELYPGYKYTSRKKPTKA